MITNKIILRKKKLSNGKYPICIRITQSGKSKYIKTVFNSSEREWNKSQGRFNAKSETYKKKNDLLIKYEKRVSDAITELELEKDYFDLEDVENKIRNTNNPIINNIFITWNTLLTELEESGKLGTARTYKETLNSIKKFINKDTLPYDEISVDFIYKYETYLRKNGNTDGGVAFKMRTVRAIYNKAIDRGYTDLKNYPFKIYKISKLKSGNIKKALNKDQIKMIENLDLSNLPKLVDSRNYFMFSYYCRGINYKDIMLLKWTQIINNRMYYKRSKTGADISVNLLAPTQKLINYYKNNSLETDYVFPILLHNNLSNKQIANRKKKKLSEYNKDLKQIAKLCNIEKDITSYVARHSFANILRQNNVSIEIISQSLAHEEISTTKAYLKSFENEIIDNAVECLL